MKVSVLWPFPAVTCGSLQCVSVVFSGHTHFGRKLCHSQRAIDEYDTTHFANFDNDKMTLKSGQSPASGSRYSVNKSQLFTNVVIQPENMLKVTKAGFSKYVSLQKVSERSHNQKLKTNPRHHEGETQNTNSHMP